MNALRNEVEGRLGELQGDLSGEIVASKKLNKDLERRLNALESSNPTQHLEKRLHKLENNKNDDLEYRLARLE